MDRLKEMMEFLKRGNKFNRVKSFVWIPAVEWKLGAREAGWFDRKEKKLSSWVHSATIPLTTEMEMKHWGKKGGQAWQKILAQLCSWWWQPELAIETISSGLQLVLLLQQRQIFLPISSNFCWTHWKFQTCKKVFKKAESQGQVAYSFSHSSLTRRGLYCEDFPIPFSSEWLVSSVCGTTYDTWVIILISSIRISLADPYFACEGYLSP